ncbi:MAG: succinyl-diaminopimelate desuccinylase [Actinomycetota bacterium]
MSDELAGRLASRTLALVDIASESGDEESILAEIRQLVPSDRFAVVDDGEGVLLFMPAQRRPGAPLLLLAGHVDTVPAAGNLPGRLEGDAVLGRGACDMKGALAVLIEVASWGDVLGASDLDVGLVCFGREELPITESVLLPLLARRPELAEAAFAIVMEPTANALEVGCMGNLNATVRATGRAAHTARPWLGENAVHTAIRALAPVVDLPTRDVEVDGLVFREVVSVTRIEGGEARNVIPDRVVAHLNVRYAPTHTPAEAEARLRELLGATTLELEIVGNAPPGPVAVCNPLLGRLRDAGDLAVGPKQAWTPVAEFATAGIDAVNFGPGDPKYAHRDDERVEVAALVRTTEIMRAFLTGSGRTAEDA